MKCNYRGTLNEIVLLGMLARNNASYKNAADKEPSKWGNY